jgi:DNA-binding LacI/PurR family transcriptional regulator
MLRKPRLHKRVTIKDVALKAGVSIGAVSRVLHGRASTIRVSEPTAEIIRQAALDLQYKPNRSSQSLRSGRTKSLTIAAPFEVSLTSSPYYASLIEGIISHAGEKGYTVCMYKGSMSESIKFEDSKGKFDGVVWLGAPKNLAEEEAARIAGTPQVGIHLVDSEVPETILNVKADEVQAVINYVGHLRVNDITKIGLFAKSGETGGLLSESNLKDLCKRLAIEFFPYKAMLDVPGLIQKSTIDAAIVWELSDPMRVGELVNANAKGARKVSVSAIVTDMELAKSNIPGKHFALPLNEMAKAAVELLISKIENPQAITSSVALKIPIPA